MTHEELAKIEAAEFDKSLRTCLRSTAFRRLLVPWLAELEDAAPNGPVSESDLPTLNFQIGQARPLRDLFDAIEQAAPRVAAGLHQEKTKYVRRRTDARHE